MIFKLLLLKCIGDIYILIMHFCNISAAATDSQLPLQALVTATYANKSDKYNSKHKNSSELLCSQYSGNKELVGRKITKKPTRQDTKT